MAPAEKAGMVTTERDRRDVREAADKLATVRQQHGIESTVSDRERSDDRVKPGDAAQERLRQAREAGERERSQPAKRLGTTRFSSRSAQFGALSCRASASYCAIWHQVANRRHFAR